MNGSLIQELLFGNKQRLGLQSGTPRGQVAFTMSREQREDWGLYQGREIYTWKFFGTFDAYGAGEL